ncbi:MAG: alpha/beta hydrolase [Planctomycetaceae bacterium]|nr:alpha/beta hydrolase [Planctomycetaceae bacterium]
MRNYFYLIVISVGLVVPVGQSRASGQSTEFEIWPGDLPTGSVKYTVQQASELRAKTTDERIAFVDRPTLIAFPAPPENANGCAVIICPGGGYNILAWRKEGTEVAEWLNTIGVTAFVLKYRVPRRIPDNIHWEPMQDIQRAIRLVRSQSAEWSIDPNRIGTLGFSAGGHLTVMSGVQFETKCYEPVDNVDTLSCRPDFICPIYCAYLGKDYDDRKDTELGSLVTVTSQTPPAFMAVTWDDSLRGAQSALLFARLREYGVPAELHAFTRGGHGYGLRPSENAVSHWPDHLQRWMDASGLLKK